MAAGPRFLLSGYYGFGNLGDEALLEVIVERLRRRWPGCAVDVLSGDPPATARTYGVEATPRMEIGRVRGAIERADVILSGGGGLLQNVTSLRSLLYYTNVIRTAIRAGKPTMVFAQSVGPLDFWGRAVVRNFCRGIAAATVRDERSRALLQSLLPGVQVERTADPVFLFEPSTEPLDLKAEGLADDDAPLVVVSVRKWAGGDATTAAMASVVDRLAARHGARVAFLPLGGPPDAEVSTTIIRRCASTPVLLPDYTLPQAAQVIGRASLVIGMRLHALIIAARLGVPFLALPYDPKVEALCADLRYPAGPLFTPGQPAPPPTELARRLDDAWERRAQLAAHLRSVRPEIERLAERNFDVLNELVTRPTHSAAGSER
ncbi:polysaccharide pyruvyl transferase CsaB [Vulcanimicrobium alpinum]|uniref:Polysaccharide pyruvyl transferase CsaB n=1 Tax=Vulcanimicrobium alpinum TaxID=3016050 RepID=A0AAN2CBG3_UNVUL|nr:polysaccharide pyruvyl transferase CsaB [Vulcanimicrobium alpinum]BDE07737.1 polysaccharide pyruvyl transferase CsaB [Vulcanimicrobium alpinum]